MGPGGAPPPSEPSDDASFLDVLAATPLGDVLLFAAVCGVGAILVAAFSVHPFITTGAGLGAAEGFSWIAGRRASGTWTTRTYVLVFLLAAAALAVVGLGFFLLLVMTCDC